MNRIAPAERPFPEDMEETLGKIMPPGVEPLLLFRVMAREPRLFRRFMAGALLDKGTLSLRQREIAIDRTCARCRAEYEWGVHVAFFGKRVGFGDTENRAIVNSGADEDCWSSSEKIIIRMMDQLHDSADIDDALWRDASKEFTESQLMELIMLAGLYHMVSFMVKATRLPLESFGAHFPSA